MLSSVSSTSSYAQLFSKLDTKNQGYLEVSDFTALLNQTDSSSTTSSASELFAALDSNQDGKVTEGEFSDTLSKLQEQLQSQLNHSRMQGEHGPEGMGGMPPPPPPPQNDAGFTKEELQSQLDEIGSTDSKRSDFIGNVVNNFEAADTDGDGRVTFSEAQAYNQNNSTTNDSTTSTTQSSANSDQFLTQILHLLRAYTNSGNSTSASNQSVSV